MPFPKLPCHEILKRQSRVLQQNIAHEIYCESPSNTATMNIFVIVKYFISFKYLGKGGNSSKRITPASGQLKPV